MTAFPPSPKIPSLRHPDLVMLQPERVWRGDEKLLPDDDRGNAGLQFADHPLERDIAQPRFILQVAAADIAVAAGEPDLVEPFGLLALIFLYRAARPPSHAGATGPVFVEIGRASCRERVCP